MLKTCVIVADRARARLFVTATPPERFVKVAPIELRELEDLTDPEGVMTGGELFSSTRSGTNRSPHGASFEYDDHRAGHRAEAERRFAKRIALATKQVLAREKPSHLVIAVEPHLLGILRHELGDELPGVTSRRELAEDLSWHTPRRILETLERHGALNATGA